MRSTAPVTYPPTLRDPSQQAAFAAEGYAVVDFLDADEVAELLALCTGLHPEPPSTWQSDFYDPRSEVKRTVHERIAATFAAAIDRHLTGHRSLLHNFVINWPGPDGGLVLHQHSSVVDESRWRSVVVWCALNPATEDNGTLHVVPRSHLVQVGPRPERTAAWFEPHHDALLRHHLVSVPVEPGQALVFDNQLLHCSFANTTDAPRITAASVVIPTDAEPYFYEWDEAAGTTRIHRLDPEFFLTNQAGDLQWADPDGLDLVGEEPWAPPAVDAAVLDTLPGGTCEHQR